jgi:CoA:oxalate CoA-transferase
MSSPMPDTTQTSAFAGLKVLDFTTTIAGPHCGRMLADFGADVIKVESPEGDMMRTRPPLREGASTSFGQLNVGKRSLVLDLKEPEAKAAALRLIADADILVENYRPGVMKRLGLDYSVVSKLNPHLIYCAISGYGQTGPSADLPAYAPVVHAASGYDLAHLNYQQGRTRPDNCGIYVADVLTGTYAFGAIATALHQRHATGKGQMLDVSMLESMLTLTLTEMQLAQFSLPPPPRPMFTPVAVKDGFVMIAVASERTFQGFAAAAGHKEWITDPRFEKYADRRQNWGILMDEFEAWSTQHPSVDVLKVLDANNVPASPYRHVRDVMQDPQLAHRDAFVPVDDAGGTFKALRPPFRMSASPMKARSFSAALGEHTHEILEGTATPKAAKPKAAKAKS